MNLIINGSAREFAEPLTIMDLLERLEMTGKRVALERNGSIVPRSLHAQTLLTDGDTLEIVVAVGGG
jgi:sulfur carrier protein